MSLLPLNAARQQLMEIKQKHFLNLAEFFERTQKEIKNLSDGDEKDSLIFLLEEVRTEYKRVQEEIKRLFAQTTTLKLVKKGQKSL